MDDSPRPHRADRRIAGALVISTGQLASVLPDYAESCNEQLDGLRTVLANAGVDGEQIHNVLSSLDIGKLVDVLSTALHGLLGVFSNLLFVLALLLFTTRRRHHRTRGRGRIRG
ncbi:MAG: hypothetical protein EOP32_31255 [Rhodococcus sp. (in: high G+C Gram-positive bacteria)]|nr:MAG: hypothetical protein EOP32_31255 [Rhodococcus sp. (in: high G+C Gram-positive bacteria)]